MRAPTLLWSLQATNVQSPMCRQQGGQKAQKQKGRLGREPNFPVAELIIGKKLSIQPPPKESRIPSVRLNTLVES